MTTQINKNDTSWLLTKGWLTTRIDALHRQMETGLSVEDYHGARGSILLARELMEHVEPSGPPQTSEDTYDVSDPDEGLYG